MHFSKKVSLLFAQFFHSHKTKECYPYRDVPFFNYLNSALTETVFIAVKLFEDPHDNTYVYLTTAGMYVCGQFSKQCLFKIRQFQH